MQASAKIRVYIVDDHPLVREGLSAFLTTQPDISVVGTGHKISEVLHELARTTADLIIVDLTLQDESGIDMLQQMQQRFPEIKTLVLTMHRSQQLMQQAIKSGARGFILKEEATTNIALAIRAIMAGGMFLTRKIEGFSAFLDEEIKENRPIIAQHLVTQLTFREQQILEFLAEGKKSQEIGERLCLSAKTINAHRQNIKRKLQLKDSAAVTAFAARWKVRQKG